MQTQGNSYFYLSFAARAMMVLALILTAILPAGLAQASGLAAPTASGDRSGVQAAPLLDENFDYGGTVGNLTTVSAGNWVAHSGGGTNPIQYALTSLSMPTYVSSGIAGSATFTSSGEDDNRTFAEQTAGPLYFAALVNISYATATGDYFMNFKNATTGYAARLFARDYAGALQFGIASGSTGTMYGTTNFAYNTTYLVVAKHDLTTGASDVFVLDTCSFTEPAPLGLCNRYTVNPHRRDRHSPGYNRYRCHRNSRWHPRGHQLGQCRHMLCCASSSGREL